MAEIHIRRDHYLGLAKARKIAWQWAEQAENDFDMACAYAESPDGDEVTFKRSGVSGMLLVTPDHFELNAKLGFLLGAFKDRNELEIVKNLDELLAQKKPAGRKGKAG
ncbi:MAG: polyhydroxyalkanoic acid system family protein [Gammaproteobacteria bacterium]